MFSRYRRGTTGTATAAGSSQTDAAALNYEIITVSGANGAKGCILPAAIPGGPPILVVNTDPASNLLVYPPVGSTINALSLNAAFTLGPGDLSYFVASGATQYYTDSGVATLSTTSINMSAGAGTITLKANIASALTVTDGTTGILVVDDRNTVTGVSALTVTASPPTIVAAAGTTFNNMKIAAGTVTLTGVTGVTALDGIGTYLGIPTVTDASAVTVTTISNLFVDLPVAGGMVTGTNIYAINCNGAIRLAGNVDASAAAQTYKVKSNTAAALAFSDGTTNILVVDSRNTLTGVQAVTVTPRAPTIAGAAGTTYQALKVAAYTLTDSTMTGVTALQGLGAYVDIPTISQSGGAVTVTTASSLYVEPPTAGGSVTITNNYAAYFNGAIRVNGNIDQSAQAVTELIKSNTAVSAVVSDGTTSLMVWDTRNTVTGVASLTIRPSPPTITGAAGVTFNVVSIPAATVTLTGSTLVTALAGIAVVISSPTVTDASAETVTTASSVQINGPLPAGMVTFTNSFALDIPTYATNGTLAAGLRVAAPSGATTNLGIQITSGGMTCAGGLTVTPATAAAITTTRALTAADSGCTFSVAKTSAYAITLPTAAAGLKFKFMVLDAGANAVTISSGAAHQFGDVSVNNVNTSLSAITTTTLVASADIGDWICFEGIDATHYLVTGACKTAAKMTFA